MEIINADTVKAIQEALAPVAERIGEGAAYVWEVVVRQQYVEGVSYLIWGGCTFLLALAAVWGFLACQKQLKGRDYDRAGWEMTAASCMFALGLLIVFTFGNITDGVKRLINPEYYALEFFITLGKSATSE